MRLFGCEFGGDKERILDEDSAGGALVSTGMGGGLSLGAEPMKTLPVVYASVLMAQKRLGSLPRKVLDASGKEVTPPYWVEQPNPWMDGFDLISSAAYSFLEHGEWFLLPKRDGRGATMAIAVPHPKLVQTMPYRKGDLGPRWRIAGREYPGEVIHSRLGMIPGDPRGIGFEKPARTKMSIGLNAQEFTNRHFSQGATMQYALTHAERQGDEAKKDIAAQVQAKHTGPAGAYAPLLADGGWGIQKMSMSAEEAELLGLTMQVDTSLAAQGYSLDPSLVGANAPGASLTYTNARDRDTQLWRDTLEPLAQRIERAISLCLPMTKTFALQERQMLLGSALDRATIVARLSAVNKAAGQEVIPWALIQEIAGVDYR